MMLAAPGEDASRTKPAWPLIGIGEGFPYSSLKDGWRSEESQFIGERKSRSEEHEATDLNEPMLREDCGGSQTAPLAAPLPPWRDECDGVRQNPGLSPRSCMSASAPWPVVYAFAFALFPKGMLRCCCAAGPGCTEDNCRSPTRACPSPDGDITPACCTPRSAAPGDVEEEKCW